MDVSAKTIREVEFREKLRGYNPDDVDHFLERVAAGVDLLHDRLRQATERAARAEQRAEESVGGDDALRRTLVLAQRTADLAIADAREQAAAMVEEAKGQAAAIVEDARQRMHQARLDAQQELRHEIEELQRGRDLLQDDIRTLGRYLDAERQRLRLALGEAIRWMDSSMPSLVPAPALNDPVIGPAPSGPDAAGGHRAGPEDAGVELLSDDPGDEAGEQVGPAREEPGPVDAEVMEAIDLDRFPPEAGRSGAAEAAGLSGPAQTENAAAR